jgi:hypothetical protein
MKKLEKMVIRGKNMARIFLRRMNINETFTNVHIQIVKQKRNFIDRMIREYFTYTSQHNHPNPRLSIVPQIARVLPVVEQGPHQPYLVGVEIQGDKFSLLVF